MVLIEDGEGKIGVLGSLNLTLKTGRVQETVVNERGDDLMLSAIKGQGTTIRPIGTSSLRPTAKSESLGGGS